MLEDCNNIQIGRGGGAYLAFSPLTYDFPISISRLKAASYYTSFAQFHFPFSF